MPSVVSNLRPFDLDDVSTIVAKQLGGPRPGKHAAQVEYFYTFKWTSHSLKIAAVIGAAIVEPGAANSKDDFQSADRILWSK